MSTRVLSIGDPHFKISNTSETDKCVERILEIIDSKDIDFVVILGDLLHDHETLHTIPLNKAINFVKEVSKRCLTFVLVGNHDMINHDQFLTENHWMNSMKMWSNVFIVDYPMQYIFNDMKFIFAPYVNTGRFEECLDKVDNWRDASCIFAHQEFYGCDFGHVPSVKGDKWSEENPEVISGHIHSRQKVGDNVYYPGSVMQHAFGESEKNVIPYTIFTKGEKKYELEEIDLQLPRKVNIKVKMEELDELEIPETEDTMRVVISGTSEEFKIFKTTEKYKKLAENPKVKIKYKSVIEDVEEGGEDIELSKNTFLELLKETIVKDPDYPDELMTDFNHIFLGDKKDNDVILV